MGPGGAFVNCPYLTLVGPEPFDWWNWLGSFTLVYGSAFFAEAAAEKAVGRAARSYFGTSGAARRAWSADHPWQSALVGVAPLPLGIELLVLLHPGPGGLRIALSVLVAIIAALAIPVVRLEQARREKDAYQRRYERAT